MHKKSQQSAYNSHNTKNVLLIQNVTKVTSNNNNKTILVRYGSWTVISKPEKLFFSGRLLRFDGYDELSVKSWMDSHHEVASSHYSKRVMHFDAFRSKPPRFV